MILARPAVNCLWPTLFTSRLAISVNLFRPALRILNPFLPPLTCTDTTPVQLWKTR